MKAPFPTALLLLLASRCALAQVPTPAPPNPFLRASYYDRLGKALRSPKKTTLVGGGKEDRAFTSLPTEAALLVGVAVLPGDWFGTPIISSLQPIYETRTGRVRGTSVGKKTGEWPLVVEAKPGYVVSQLLVSAPNDHVHGLKIVFRRLDVFHQGVVANDTYESDWLGIAFHDQSVRIGDATRPTLGLCGRAEEWVAALGLIQVP